MQNYKKLAVWEKAHLLTVSVYMVTAGYPKEELYGLTAQTRRACSSIPANIAEGCGRDGQAELGRFLQIAYGSASELEYHLLLAHDLKFINEEEYALLDAQTAEVKRMLNSFIKKLKNSLLVTHNSQLITQN